MSKALAVNATVSGRQRFFDFLYKWGMLLTVVLLVAVFGLASDNFLDPFNIINILRSIAIVTVIAIGVSISLTIGGFDLSVGSTASLANALVISLFVWHGLGTTEAILITLALCTLVGLFNAFLIVVLRIPDMLATLASLFVIQGVAMTYSYGGSITENMVLPSGEMAEGTIPAAFGALGQVPTIVIIMLVVTLVAQLAHSEKLDGITLPEPDVPPARHALADSAPRIVLNDGVVSYNDRPVINHLSWTVNPGEHWQIVGPNGAGKSTLLSLVTGDHPQGYSNDLTLFGRRRGSGETIWDIKKHIGYVSSSLHLDYRVSTNVRNVILSGYFDSIGIYQAVSDKQHKLVQQWLDILGIDKRTADAPFHSLSWGQQRLALIVRALVKHPTLLILDEPLQGLDPLNRQLVRRFVDVLIGEGATQLLFVSHHAEDAPDCITHRLAFVPSGDGYTYQLGPVA